MSEMNSSDEGSLIGEEDLLNNDDAYDGWDEDIEESFACAVCPHVENDMSAWLRHLHSEHALDWVAMTSGLDFYGRIRLLNWTRLQIAEGKKPEDVVVLLRSCVPESDYDSEAFLRPALDNDAVLMHLDDEALFSSLSDDHHEACPDYKRMYEQLLDQFQAMRDRMQSLVAQDDGNDEQVVRVTPESGSDYYFNSYATIDIHEAMLKDRVRTEAYRDFIYQNKHWFKDKVVLDVGCGTGILSLFAARSGASKVYAVDNSDMLEHAQRIAAKNGMQDRIVFIKGRMEDLRLPEHVDIIVSEWMGYFLLYEGMLDSVIHARDRWMKPDGRMLPSKSRMLLAGMEDDEWMNDREAYWNDVYGFDLTDLKCFLYKNANVDYASKDGLATDAVVIKEIDCNTTSVLDLDFTSHFEMVPRRDATIHGFCGWFDIDFDATGCQSVHFTTSPEQTPTHWKQTVFVLEQGPLTVTTEDRIQGTIRCQKRASNPRELDIHLQCHVVDVNGGNVHDQRQQDYVLC